MSKVCTVCEMTKDLNDFYKYYKACKKCTNRKNYLQKRQNKPLKFTHVSEETKNQIAQYLNEGLSCTAIKDKVSYSLTTICKIRDKLMGNVGGDSPATPFYI